MHFLHLNPRRQRRVRAPRWRRTLTVCCLLLLGPTGGHAQSVEKTLALQALATERELLTAELEQYRQTLAILLPEGGAPEESANPAVRKLAREVLHLKERLVALAEEEVTLLQQQITDARSREQQVTATLEEQEQARQRAIESKPLRTINVDYTQKQEMQEVERLHALLESYHADIQESSQVLPTEEELRQREQAQRDAEKLSRIPFSVDKVRLSGAEGSTALTHITRRLMDPRIPESRRDIAPICSIRTRRMDVLVSSDNRSLTPVGKNHYVARISLPPGDTTLSILDDRWEVHLPDGTKRRDYLVTFYRPQQAPAELHVVAVDELLALEYPYIPAWLPQELNIEPGRG
ncbi:MAG: hypothetical protein CME59_22435 [Halioglobus sp.]|nr:hypothetical protein [Halioglobus sp.]